MPTVAIIGAGFGGLAEAIRLQSRGFQVTIFEKRERPGGRAYRLERNGYTFDMGPSLITAPFIVERVFAAAGKRMRDYLDLVPLDPFYRVYFGDRSHIDYTGNPEKMKEEIARLSPADASSYDRFFRDIKGIYNAVIGEGLGSRPFDTLRSFLSFLPRAIRLGSLRSVYGSVSRYFTDERIRFLFSFHPLFIGGSPFRAPSVYLMIPYLEREGGVWFARGGMYSVVEAFEKVFRELGGTIRTGTEVEEIVVQGGKATGVRVNGEVIPADAVVSNGDVPWVYRNLIPIEHRPRGWSDGSIDRLKMSMSCFLLYIGTRRQFPRLKHHTLIVSKRYRELVKDIFDRKVLSQDFSLYLHVPTRTDPSMAPPGGESMYVLLPVPHQGSGIDWSTASGPLTERLLGFLEEEFGLEGLRNDIEVLESFTPADFATELNAHLGSAFSIEPRLTQSAYFRPHNRSGAIERLYFVGAGTHPGGGVPGVLLGAEATESCILEDFPPATRATTPTVGRGNDQLPERAIRTFEESREYTRKHAKSFYFASRILPREKRMAAFAVYGFCRYVDDIADSVAGGVGSGNRAALALRLQGLRNELDVVYERDSPTGEWMAFRETVLAYGIPKEYFLALIEGVEMDLGRVRYRTFVELEEYCYRVASVVGLIMTRIFGVSSDRALAPAADLGTAMQLTNILRDVGEDFRMGRIYLPQEDLDRFGVAEADLQAGIVTPAFRDLMRFEIGRARELYRRAAEGVPFLTNDGSRFCVDLMGTTYAEILDAIERNGYDVFTRRASVPLRRKVGLALRRLSVPEDHTGFLVAHQSS